MIVTTIIGSRCASFRIRMYFKENHMNGLNAGALLQGGKYKIEKTLGQGGFGITYLAEQTNLGRRVCIKEFFMKEYGERQETSDSDLEATALTTVTAITSGAAEIMARYREKFVKEARTIALLDHPGIVRIHDVFEENGTAYYVMDYIEGENLNEMVKREGALPEARALGYICQVAEALSYIHGQHIMHLDVKPSNILVRKSDDSAILIDFGTAKRYDSSGTQTSATPVGLSAGYAPIELTKPGGVQTFSPETDVYSLGATLYYLVTGQNPPDASERMEMIIEGEKFQFPDGISSSTAEVIEQSMQARKRRIPNVDEFLERCSDVLEKYVLKCLETEEKADAVAAVKPHERAKNNGFENGHEWVDLGLSVKWATCNIGANSPEEYGDYFAWGEVSPKKSFTIGNSKYSGFWKDKKYNKKDNKRQLDSTDDAAMTNWRGRWRMPTLTEIQELIANTTIEIIANNGRLVFKISSKKNGNSILFPAAGYMLGDSTKYENQGTIFLSSTCNQAGSVECGFIGIKKILESLGKSFLRQYGAPVRPVCPQ